MDRLNPATNGEVRGEILPAKPDDSRALRKVENVRSLIPTDGISLPISGRDIMDSVQRSLGSFQTIVTDIKDVLRGVEADVRAIETIQIVEEPNKRTVTIQRKYRITKDR